MCDVPLARRIYAQKNTGTLLVVSQAHELIALPSTDCDLWFLRTNLRSASTGQHNYSSIRAHTPHRRLINDHITENLLLAKDICNDIGPATMLVPKASLDVLIVTRLLSSSSPTRS